MFPPSKEYAALSRNPIAEDRASLYKELRDYGKFTGLCWLMSPEKPPVTLSVRTVEDIILLYSIYSFTLKFSYMLK